MLCRERVWGSTVLGVGFRIIVSRYSHFGVQSISRFGI